MVGHDLIEYLKLLEGKTFPPLLVELLLKSGRSYFIKNVFRPNSEREMIGFRVWDLRTVDVGALPAKLNAVDERETWENFFNIDSALDQANLWIRPGEIEGIVEWHERFWPLPEPEKEAAPIGFSVRS